MSQSGTLLGTSSVFFMIYITHGASFLLEKANQVSRQPGSTLFQYNQHRDGEPKWLKRFISDYTAENNKYIKTRIVSHKNSSECNCMT